MIMCESSKAGNGNGKYVGSTYTSLWRNKNGGLLKVITMYREGHHHATAFFAGANPFPCFSMETSYLTLAKWLEDRGWVRKRDSTKHVVKWERYTLVEKF